jgi:ubiquinone/menaquinone biosynthesis C-methylase UbiE
MMSATHGKNLKKVYDEVASSYDNQHKEDLIRQDLDIFLQYLSKSAKVLDFGCGPGRDGEYFALQDIEVTFLDISPQMLAIARKKVPSATFIEADMTEVELPGEEYDGIWANASLLHLTKVEIPSVLEKIFSSLKPGGVFFVSLKEGEGEKEETTTRFQNTDRPVARFFAFYSYQEIRTLLENVGFTVIETIMRPSRSSSFNWLRVFAKKN